MVDLSDGHPREMSGDGDFREPVLWKIIQEIKYFDEKYLSIAIGEFIDRVVELYKQILFCVENSSKNITIKKKII